VRGKTDLVGIEKYEFTQDSRDCAASSCSTHLAPSVITLGASRSKFVASSAFASANRATRSTKLRDESRDRRGGYCGLKELASYCGLSVRTLRTHLVNPLQPLPHFRVRGKILVRRLEFDAWLQQFRREQEGQDLGDVVSEIVNSFCGKV
jgi:hypothetical protein